MRNITMFVVVMFAAMGHAHAGVERRLYKNEEFHIMAGVPTGGVLCTTSTAEHDHGPLIRLGGSKDECGEYFDTRYIELFASYSVTGEPVSLKKFLISQCIDVGAARCEHVQDIFSIKGKRIASGIIKHRNGKIDIFVVTQGIVKANYITYTCRLHTSARKQATDILKFREFLDNTQLH